MADEPSKQGSDDTSSELKRFESLETRAAFVEEIFAATRHEDPAKQAQAFYVLSQILSQKSGYAAANELMSPLSKATLTALKSDEDNVVIQAIEVWVAICDIERQDEESAEYTQKFCQYLVPELLRLLTTQSVDSETGDAIADSPACAAAALLSLLGGAAEDALLPHVVPFVGANLVADDWHAREAAMLAFGAILDGPSEEMLLPLVPSVLPALLTDMSGHSQQLVRDTATWTLGRIFCHMPAAVLDNLPAVLAPLCTRLEDDLPVAARACVAIIHLAESVADMDATAAVAAVAATAGSSGGGDLLATVTASRHRSVAGSNALSPVFQVLVGKLLQTADRPEASGTQLPVLAYETINALAKAAASDVLALCAQLLPLMLTRLGEAVTQSQSGDGDAQTELATATAFPVPAHLCGFIQDLCGRMDLRPFADDIMTLLLNLLKVGDAALQYNAMATIGALINSVGAGAAKYVQATMPFLSRVMQAALKGSNDGPDKRFVIATIGVFGDFCRAVPEAVPPMCDGMMQLLLRLLTEARVSIAVKPVALLCIADVLLALKGHSQRYLQYVLNTVQQGLEALANIPKQQRDAMGEALCVTFSAVLQATRLIEAGGVPSGPAAALFPKFAELTAQVVANPEGYSTPFLLALAALAGDMLNSGAAPLLQKVPADSLRAFVDAVADMADTPTLKFVLEAISAH